MRYLAILFALCSATVCRSQEPAKLLDAPKPKIGIEAAKPKVEHSFYDRTAKIELTAWAIVGGFDMAQTCWRIGPEWREQFAPAQSCPGIVGFSAGMIAVEELSRYAFHRTHHRKLERLAPLVAIAGNAAGIVRSSFGFGNGPGRPVLKPPAHPL